MSDNIVFNTDQIATYYSQNRIAWHDFYESERHVMDLLHLTPGSSVLDVGCGCGGLGLVLSERYGCTNYLGVEINAPAVQLAKQLNPFANIICSDILDPSLILPDKADVVFSLSCIDWNVEFQKMLAKCWSCVSPNGYLVLSLRLTDKNSILDESQSFQYISFDGTEATETAPYSVLNINDCIVTLLALSRVEDIYAYGYVGPPSITAVTPYKEICFSVFRIKKSVNHSHSVSIKLDIPLAHSF